MSLGAPIAQHGVVDMFIETVTIEVSPTEHIEVLVPARVLLGKKAGYVVRALEIAIDALSLRALQKLDRVILLVDNADSASSNRKAMHYLSKEPCAVIDHHLRRDLLSSLLALA